MAHYRASIDIQQPRDDVFAYLSDFSTTEEWDPGVVEAERLNDQAVCEGTEFRLVVAFRREQQRLVDRWLSWLIDVEQHRSDVAVYGVPVLSSVYGPARWFIDGGMTRGISDAVGRARTITVYTEVRKVVDNLGLAGTDTIAVLLVERSGQILAGEVGGFEEQKAERLTASLAPTPSPTAS
jgi:hypothetical protein